MISGSGDAMKSFEEVKSSGPSTGQRFVTFADRPPQQPPQSGVSSMKRGLSNFMATVDAAFKHSTTSVAGSLSWHLFGRLN